MVECSYTNYKSVDWKPISLTQATSTASVLRKKLLEIQKLHGVDSL